MGGFLLLKKNEHASLVEVEELYLDSLAVFRKKGLACSQKICNKHYAIFLFHKYSLETPDIVRFGPEDFVLSTGTCLYQGKTGTGALKALFEDFSSGRDMDEGLRGNYAILLSHAGKLFVFNDYLGLYRIYTDESKRVFSNSFLAVARTLRRKSISKQEVYEYLFHLAFYGDATIYKEVEMLPNRRIWQVHPKVESVARRLETNEFHPSQSFDEMVEAVAWTQVEHFNLLKNNFGKIVAGLTGGYDTRLMLALMRKVGIVPNLYIYDRGSQKDVEIAQTIAAGEGIDLDYINKDSHPEIDRERYREVLTRNFYVYDGFRQQGLFENGTGIDTKLRFMYGAHLQLSGAGGEIYRNFWHLPERDLSIPAFLKAEFDLIDHTICTDRFDKRDHFAALAAKMQEILGIDGLQMTRLQADMLYPLLRMRYWQSINNSINNQFIHALTPFIEPKLIYQSFSIPLRHKHLGRFQAALIRHIDVELAKYPTVYGFNFCDEVGVSRQLGDLLMRNTPIFIRPFLRRQVRRHKHHKPYFLQDEYLAGMFCLDKLAINEFVKVRQIEDPNLLSRALSLELLIEDKL